MLKDNLSLLFLFKFSDVTNIFLLFLKFIKIIANNKNSNKYIIIGPLFCKIPENKLLNSGISFFK